MKLRFSLRLDDVRARARVTLVLLLTLAAPDLSQAQNGTWTAHTSMREVTSISSSDDALWVGTTGGIFSYGPGSGEIRRFTIADGLHGTQVRAVAFDADCLGDSPCVWIGYQDGVLERLDPEGRTVETFRDIQRADRFPRREINRLVVQGDSLLVATSFGLVVFDAGRAEVRDSYTQLGSLTAATPVYDATVGPGDDGSTRLWLATDGGIAHAPLNAPNLKDPATWTVETAGLPAIETRALAHFDGRLHVGTTRGHAVRATGGTYTATGFTTALLADLIPADGRLLGVDAFALIAVEPGGQGRRMPATEFNRPTTIAVGPQGSVWVGDQLEGLVEITPPTGTTTTPEVRQRFFPEGPYHNTFDDLLVDDAGRLWAGGVFAPGSGNGLYRMDEAGVWTDFIGRTRAELQGKDSFTRLHVDADGNLWAGSQGRGVAVVKPDDEVQIVNETNSSLRNAEPSTDSTFILVGGIGSDPRGQVWVTARASSRPLNVRTTDGTWTNMALRDCGALNASSGTYDRLFVDSYGQLWIDVKSRTDLRRGIGLVVLNPMNTPADPSDDACRFFGSIGAAGSGMPGLEVLSFAEDNAGRTWIATDKGLAYFINNGIIAQDPGATPIWPQYEDRTQGVFLFQGLRINDVAVDPANQLWVATDAGAYLIRQVGSGFEEVQHLTTENSPLLSNVVVAVAVAPASGDVFFSTDRGLVSFEGDAIAASPSSRDLVVYPNPVRIAADEEPAIFIEGLVEETEIMILAAQGAVVSRFMARGGRARWDGRDQSGRLVPSGMYLVVAIGQNGEERAFGKVGIVR